MARDWALIEFRPGRYAKMSPDGEFLGLATEVEVRAWFATGERVQKLSAIKPPSPLSASSQKLPEAEQPLCSESPALREKPSTSLVDQGHSQAPPSTTQSQQPPAGTPPRAEIKPLPPFLEHLRGAPEPILPQAAPVQEPKPLPPFLARKRGEASTPEMPTKPELFGESSAVVDEIPPSLAKPEQTEEAPAEKPAAAEPEPEQPKPQGRSPDPLNTQLDLFDLDLDESPEEAEPVEVQSQAELPHVELNEDWLGEEEEDLGLEPSGPPTRAGRERPAPVVMPPAAEAPVSQDGAGRWLWLDPRQEVNHNPLTSDLAAFLQRAIALFQSKEWTGGQKPGRLAVHPDEMVDRLRSVAETLGLEVECDPLVNPGTYRLALPKDKAR